MDEIMKLACRKLIVRDPAQTRQFFTNAVEVKQWLSWERLNDEVFAAKKDSYPLDIIEPFKVKQGTDTGPGPNMPSKHTLAKQKASYKAEQEQRAKWAAMSPEEQAREQAKKHDALVKAGLITETKGEPK